MNANRKRVVNCAMIVATVYLVLILATVASFKWGSEETRSIAVVISTVFLSFLWYVPFFYKEHREKFCSVCGKKGIQKSRTDKFKEGPGYIREIITIYRCDTCNNNWKKVERYEDPPHPPGCQCYDCVPYEGWRGTGHL